MTRFVVATTLAAFVMDQEDTWRSWLRTAREMKSIAAELEDEVRFFAAIQTDARGIEPFQPLIYQLENDGIGAPADAPWSYGDYWTYSLDDGRTEVTTANRLRHIVAGQNFASDYAQSVHADFLLFMAADCMPPADAPWRLNECADDFDARVVGGEVSTYCLGGYEVSPPSYASVGLGLREWTENPGYYPVQAHMPTAAFVMLDALAIRKLRWRWCFEDGSDDPCLYRDALDKGWRVVVRKDVIGRHFPESIGAIETRGHDMTVVRSSDGVVRDV
jgi:hypothetical protein